MIRILVVEDDPAIRELLIDYFTGQEFLVDAAESLAEAKKLFQSHEPAIVLLDLSLPDGDGVSLIRFWRAQQSSVPIIVLTARGAEEWRVRGLEAGADDYVVKPFSIHELLARVRAILRRSGARPTRVQIGAAEIDFVENVVRRDGQVAHLAQKEAELLAHLLRHADRPHRRSELLHAVWGFDESPSTRTVDTHIFNLRQKIESTPDQPCHFITVHGIGYRFVP